MWYCPFLINELAAISGHNIQCHDEQSVSPPAKRNLKFVILAGFLKALKFHLSSMPKLMPS